MIITILILLTGSSLARNPFSAYSKYALKHQATSHHRLGGAYKPNDYQAFIEVDDSLAIERLRQCGVTVNSMFDGFITAMIPAHALDRLESLHGIRHVSIGHRVFLCNDSARFFSGVEPLHAGSGLVTPLDGCGVIVGMIDSGMDFNHINFCDKDGKSRVRAVYLPCDSTGPQPIVENNPLPGSCYESPDQINSMTTDCDSASHGSHTAGTATGSYRNNGLHGVAPGADIVACGMPEDQLTDVNIANCVRYIVDYAARVGKPCVINMSIGTNEGPNDGSSFLCRTFASLSGPGRICVLSAGNDGDSPVCFHYALKGARDTVTTLLRNQWGGLHREGYVSMWSSDATLHKSRVVIINRSSGELEYVSPLIADLPVDSVFTISSDNDPDFARFYKGEMSFTAAWEPQLDDAGDLLDESMWRYHSYWIMDATSLVAGHLLGLQYVADQETELAGWCTKKTFFYTFGLEGMTGGSPVGSISDLATCDSVISVGAYCTRKTYIDHHGEEHVLALCSPNDIAPFSSFGPDERGIDRPDVCAPGYALLSSGNRFDEKSARNTWLADEVVDGEAYPYYSNQGTSMSAPVIAGAVALMLQVNPSLTPSMIKEVIKRTSIQDYYVLNGDPRRWGAGKLDIEAAVNDVINRTLLPGDVNNDGEVNIADIQLLVDVVQGKWQRHDAATLIRADVNQDHEILISDINSVIDLILK